VLSHGKSTTDAVEACAGFSNQDTAKLPSTLSPAELTVKEQGNAIHVYAQFRGQGEPPNGLVHLVRLRPPRPFIPGISSSRTVSRTGAEAIVEQKGSAGLGPFRQSFHRAARR